MSIEPETSQPSVINVGEYLDGLYSYALILSHSRSDAEDLVLKTCLQTIRTKNRLTTGSDVKSWIFTTLRNIWLSQRRKPKNEPELEPDENRDSDTSRNSHISYVPNIECEQIRSAIQQLPIGSREIIILRIYEGFSYQEIAKIVGCPVSIVVSRLSRARQRLRGLLL